MGASRPLSCRYGFVALFGAIAFASGCGGGTVASSHGIIDGTGVAATGQPAGTQPTVATASTVVPHPAPLPSISVDESRFPKDPPARFQGSQQTLHVAPTGDDTSGTGAPAAPFRTIGRALAAASTAPGTAVEVRAGTYPEGDGQHPYALKIDAARTILRAAPGEVVHVTPASARVRNALSIVADGATVSGFSFEGFSSSAIGIGVSGRTVGDIVIADVSIDLPAGGDGIAIYVPGTATNPAVAGLLVDRVSIHGADSGFTVSSGYVTDISLRAVSIKNRTSGAPQGGYDAIGVPAGDNIAVNGIEIAGADGNGIDLYATRVAIVNAHVHDVQQNGVQLHGGGDIVNALIHDCGADASIVLEADLPGLVSGDYRLVNCMVAFHNRPFGGGSAYAMTVGGANPQEPMALTLLNTVFYKNAGGIMLSVGTRTDVRGCAFFGEANDTVAEYAWDGSTSQFIDDTGAVSDLSALGSASGNIAFATDPGLTDPAASTLDGFRPGVSSPLVDAGEAPALMPGVDLLGAPRTAGQAPDVGPIEAR